MKTFSLLALVALTLVGCGTEDTTDTSSALRISDIAALTGDATAGLAVYETNCTSCHGVDAAGGSAPGLAGINTSIDDQIDITLNGLGTMSGYDFLTDQEIADVIAYTSSL